MKLLFICLKVAKSRLFCYQLSFLPILFLKVPTGEAQKKARKSEFFFFGLKVKAIKFYVFQKKEKRKEKKKCHM